MRVWMGVVVTLCVLVGCGGASPDEWSGLERAEVETGWDATHSVLSSITLGTGADLSLPVSESSFEHPCAGGGSAWVESDTEVEVAIGRLDARVTFYVHFEGCKKNGVDITGAIAYNRLYALRGGDLDVSFSWSGDLAWEGSVEGVCGVALDGFSETTHAVLGRNFVELGFGAEFEGSICGLDARTDLDWSMD